jgi:hypothetical protein
VVLEAQGQSPAADEALEKLCRTYWRPVHGFIKCELESSGRQRARGIDFSLQYQFQTANWGTFTWSNDWTYLDSFLFQFNSDAKTREVSGRTNNDPFEGAFFGQVTIGDGFLK